MHRENGEVDLGSKGLFAENDSRSGTSKSLVSGRRDDIAVRERVSHHLTGD